ncbi:hypothetical protein SAMN05216431_10142 [Ligilactobacillus sp. WC1T17]|uniref:Acyltransferase 3 domain-containing protein n=1 Tax=Ligilactobacillus ruminis TaxID=1623 RepID=A0ABY1A8V4_9LACO|nr:hypothetical protein SAMN05216431_10142 [Ligilactobacillus ruminis]
MLYFGDVQRLSVYFRDFKASENEAFKLLLFSFALMIVSERLVPAFYAHNYLGLSRVQLFIVGSYYGAKIYQDEPFSLFNKLFVLAGAVLFVANIWTVASGRGELHPALIKLFTPIPLMVAAAWILGCFKFDGKVNSFLKKAGALSLELYVVHVSLRALFSAVGIGTSSLLTYGGMIVLVVLLSMCMNNFLTPQINKMLALI